MVYAKPALLIMGDAVSLVLNSGYAQKVTIANDGAGGLLYCEPDELED
jgi:hypothetical protein